MMDVDDFFYGALAVSMLLMFVYLYTFIVTGGWVRGVLFIGMVLFFWWQASTMTVSHK